ncbi:hypothetical protein [Streptomyces phaeochromogenes]
MYPAADLLEHRSRMVDSLQPLQQPPHRSALQGQRSQYDERFLR